MNICSLIGRLTSDPELKHTQSGTAVTSFTIAVDRKCQKPGEQRKADFINVVAWRQTAEFICKYFTKGQMIAIEGELQTRQYENKDGEKRTATEIIVNNTTFCGDKRGMNNGQNENPSVNFEEVINDDLPF